MVNYILKLKIFNYMLLLSVRIIFLEKKCGKNLGNHDRICPLNPPVLPTQHTTLFNYSRNSQLWFAFSCLTVILISNIKLFVSI